LVKKYLPFPVGKEKDGDSVAALDPDFAIRPQEFRSRRGPFALAADIEKDVFAADPGNHRFDPVARLQFSGFDLLSPNRSSNRSSLIVFYR